MSELAGQPVSIQRTAADVDRAAVRVANWLDQPLDAESAVAVALLNNRGLQAQLTELGIAEADRVRAGRWPNPVLGFSRVAGGGVTEIDRSATVNLLGLLMLPLTSEVANAQLEQAQLQAAADAVSLATDARKAFYMAVAAQVLVTYAGQVKAAADAASELAKRMQQAGNFNALARLREQAFAADAAASLVRARHQALSARERLVRLLGTAGFTLPERLPDLPPAIEAGDAEQTAIDRRLDVQLARRGAQMAARSLGLTRATRFVNVLDVGIAGKSRTGEPRQRGYQVELELPLFDFGATRAARAESVYMRALHRTAQVAVDAQSDVREAYSAYRTAYDLARHYSDEAVPLKRRIADENLLRYNGMLVSVFELLADARDQVATVTAAVEALRDHWVAEAELQGAIAGRLQPEISKARQ